MGKIFKSFLFDGRKSEDFGVYISGPSVYDAPERDVELIDIPGRDGEIVLDNGRYKNIRVTYPAGAYGKTQAEFAQRMDAIRNFLASRVGYQRLEDEYNLDEFRLGVYSSGLQVDPAARGKAGTFDLVFNCKPQRYLKSGEVEYEITNGGEIFNPTDFKSAPIIEAYGRGQVVLNGYKININADPVGDTPLFRSKMNDPRSFLISQDFEADPGIYITGDQFKIKKSVMYFAYIPPVGATINSFPDPTVTDGMTIKTVRLSNGQYFVSAEIPEVSFNIGTSGYNAYNASIPVIVTISGTSQTLYTELSARFTYDGDQNIELYVQELEHYMSLSDYQITLGNGVVTSTKSALNQTVYIDCEIGHAYLKDGDSFTSFNSAVEIPADLPRLSPGNNAITFDASIESLKLIPRWWKI